MTLSVAEKANVFSTGNNKVYSNGGSRKDQCSDGVGARIGNRGSKKRPLHYGSRQGEEPLHLQRIWAHGLLL